MFFFFTPKGAKICCFEPGDEFEGEWEPEADGNVYRTVVVPFEESFGN